MKYLYTSKSYVVDGSSIAATWVWAPAIYLSFELGVRWGLWGFLMFWVPNFIGLIIFGAVAHHLRQRMNGFAISDVAQSARAKALVSASSFIMLCLSNVVQLTGCVFVLRKYFSCPDWQIAVVLSALVFLYAVFGGLKWCVLTDFAKYVIFLSLGLWLLWSHGVNIPADIAQTSPVVDPLLAFGLITAVNLLSAEYCDQTFWQRAWSYDKHRVFKSFFMGGVLFALIPLIFGLLGMSMQGGDWNAANVFTGWQFDVIVLTALIATLDSNLCGAENLAWRLRGCSETGRLPVIISFVVLALANIIFLSGLPILVMFLIYGTVRLSACVTIVSCIFNKTQKYSMWLTAWALLLGVPAFVVLGLLGSDLKNIVTVGIVVLSVLVFFKDRKSGGGAE